MSLLELLIAAKKYVGFYPCWIICLNYLGMLVENVICCQKSIKTYIWLFWPPPLYFHKYFNMWRWKKAPNIFVNVGLFFAGVLAGNSWRPPKQTSVKKLIIFKFHFFGLLTLKSSFCILDQPQLYFTNKRDPSVAI